MEIKIRSIDAAAVKKIDQIAKRQGLSRNEYLKRQIEHLALMPELLAAEDQYRNLVKEILPVISANNSLLEKNAALHEELLSLLKED